MIRLLNLYVCGRSGFKRTRRGFSLIDVLIAMVILLITIGWATQIAIQLVRTTQEDGRITAASNLADYKLEELRNMDYAAVVDGAEASTIDSMGNSPGEFTRSWSVLNDTPDTGMKFITVSISWDQWNETRTYQMTGVIGQ